MDGIQSFDALMPRQIAAKAEDAGVAKARMDTFTAVLLAVLAGAFISLGAVFSTVASTGVSGVVPFGLARIIAGLAFSLGLILVVVAGAELFTGNNLLVIAYASKKVTARQVFRNWLLVYVGNFVGAMATAAGMFAAALHEWGDGQVGRTALVIAEAKCSLSFEQAFMRGVYCNALVCMAVWLCVSCRSTGDKILAIVFPITAFVAAGFEHSVANMYFIPAALLIKDLGSAEYWTSLGAVPNAFPHVTWGNLVRNLIPVTLGNIIGGAVLVGAVYWVIYGRKKPTEALPHAG
jgi:formate transporter